jgi:hypothetical protein
VSDLIEMRQPCPRDGCTETQGRVTEANGQRVVRCAWCNRHCYNQPRDEAGLAPQKIKTREPFKLGQRQRILERDGHACVSCHATDRPLHIGHLVSVHDGRRLGMDDAELNDDLNLAAMCDACNLGLGERSLPPRLVWAAIRAAAIRKGVGRDEVA